ncbi:hypothetical protein MmiAt1_01910 [Methanimicrococcus sp. At1]|uniref:Restriction endonuclease type IV Mrr domain-containing protein n=1 Tax=Methanimicrococcus hacksteinii TaxID=3028293 RepID=A0ABU3VMM5_9EURY|nr:restriction endonuclease [Methanimicrococcus sp. At1]MDV0444659.1 hypothetical protein [Methanimicrococcus sp. At1]
MANFSKYLGKDERVLNSIDMKDETVWSQNNVAASEYKSWTTLVLTNKRLFSLNKRKLSMREFRLEDVVSTGWTYRPQWGKILWGAVYLIAAVLVYLNAGAIGTFLANFASEYFGVDGGSDVAVMLSQWAVYGAVLLGVLAIISLFSYFLLKRTTFSMTTKDGREYSFLLRGRRNHIDEFRMAVQDARDLYIEETENRYFDKMRTVLFDQSNYEYALNNVQPAGTPVEEPQTEKLKKEEYLLWERKNAKLDSGPEREQIGNGTGQTLLPETTMRLASDGTLLLDTGGAHQLTADGTPLLDGGQDNLENSGTVKSAANLAEASLAVKAADLFEQTGFEVSRLNADDADLLLYKDNFRYIVVVDEDEFGTITPEKIDRVISAKSHYKTDFGLFISAGDMPDNVQEYANRNNVKIVYIKKAE